MHEGRDRERLQHILSHAREAMAMAAGRTRQDLDSDRALQIRLVHLIEVVGEAAARASAATKARLPSIPWRVMTDMRNRLIHGYDTIDYDVIWDTVVLDLPQLVAELGRVLG